jgi:protein SCO1/2
MLCPMVISGIIDATGPLAESGDWVPGEHYEILTLSINPDDNPAKAMEQQQTILDQLAGEDEVLPPAAAEAGWHFLTGREVDIAAVADAAGFGYARVPQTNDFAHAAVVVFASPEGVITRYLPGHVYPVKDFRMALTEAGQGTQGSLFDMILQLCYRYDDQRGTYTPVYLTIMKLAGAVTLVTVIGVIGGMFYFERRRTAALTGAEPPEGD